ncbi:hypothetical protein [Crenalkalicoccus roseus]|uniref:hypothetical protein n=1 Tax=Crenalkalicoccus roseus TaxID=1485588 RepID=UPI00108006B4|nr:hypothetical protein [Crenalkalicoccus roseus]
MQERAKPAQAEGIEAAARVSRELRRGLVERLVRREEAAERGGDAPEGRHRPHLVAAPPGGRGGEGWRRPGA